MSASPSVRVENDAAFGHFHESPASERHVVEPDHSSASPPEAEAAPERHVSFGNSAANTQRRQSSSFRLKRFLKGIRGDCLAVRQLIDERQTAAETERRAHEDGLLHHSSPGPANTKTARAASTTSITARITSCTWWLLALRVLMWRVLSQIDMTLRGVSQVYLLSNPISGVLILIGLALSQDPLRAGFAVAGAFCATVGGAFALLGARSDSAGGVGILFPSATDTTAHDLVIGLYGYDGTLTAIAVRVFTSPVLDTVFSAGVVDNAVWSAAAAPSSSSSPPSSSAATALQTSGAQIVAALVLSFLVGAVVRKALGRLFGAVFGLPPFTISFNTITLILLFSLRATRTGLLCYSGSSLYDAAASPEANRGFCPPTAPQASGNATEDTCGLAAIKAASALWNEQHSAMWIDAFLTGVSQFIFVDTRLGAIFVVLAFMWADLLIAAQACGGAILGTVFGFCISGWPSLSADDVAVVSRINNCTALTATPSQRAALFALRERAATINSAMSGLFGYCSVGTAVVTLGQSTTHAERVGLLELFRSVDRDGDGGVDERELSIFIQRLLHVLAEKRAHEGGDDNNSDDDEEQEDDKQQRRAMDEGDLRDGSDDENATRRGSISKQQQQHHSFTEEEFADFFAGIPKADPHFLSVDEFSQWWHSVIVGAPSAAGGNDAAAAAASSPIHVIAFERKAPLWMQCAEAVIYVFVCALLQPFLTAVVTAPFPVLTMPFCCASWLRKLAVAVSAPVAPAAAPAAPAPAAADSKAAPADSGNKKSGKTQQQAAAAADSSPTTIATAASFRRGESLVNKLRVLSGSSPAASASNVFGISSGSNAASFRQSPAAGATPTSKSPTFDAPAAKKEDNDDGNGNAPPPQSGSPRRVTRVFQRRAAWNTSSSNAASAAAINPLVFQADRPQDNATAQEVSVEDIGH